jgi:hypothetical protein
MPLRKNIDSSTSPIIDTKVAITVSFIVVIVGAVIALLKLSGVWALFFTLVGIGITFLGIGKERIHRASLCLFAAAPILLGIGLAPLFH